MKYAYSIIGILLYMAGFTQDIIILRNGNELKVKVFEINQKEIKYRQFDFMDGPLYSVQKTEIFLIKYENGTRELFSENKKIIIKEEPVKTDNANSNPGNNTSSSSETKQKNDKNTSTTKKNVTTNSTGTKINSEPEKKTTANNNTDLKATDKNSGSKDVKITEKNNKTNETPKGKNTGNEDYSKLSDDELMNLIDAAINSSNYTKAKEIQAFMTNRNNKTAGTDKTNTNTVEKKTDNSAPDKKIAIADKGVSEAIQKLYDELDEFLKTNNYKKAWEIQEKIDESKRK